LSLLNKSGNSKSRNKTEIAQITNINFPDNLTSVEHVRLCLTRIRNDLNLR